MVDQALGFAQSRAGDADGACVELARGEVRTFMVLEMRPELGWNGPEERRHPFQVRLHAIEVDQEGGGVQLLFSHLAPLAGVRWRTAGPGNGVTKIRRFPPSTGLPGTVLPAFTSNHSTAKEPFPSLRLTVNSPRPPG